MASYFWAFCVTVVLASLTRRSGAPGPVIRCQPCTAAARLLCPPLPTACTERVQEPGCGCCLTCALRPGQPCGVYTGRCGAGLNCQHLPGDSRPLQALLEGRGVCANTTERRAISPQLNDLPVQTAQAVDEERNSTGSARQTSDGPRRAPRPAWPAAHPLLPSAKSNILRRDQYKQTQSFKMEDLPGLVTGPLRFSLEAKQEPDYGPCRREMESILSSLKVSSLLNPRGFRIPNCDKKGFFKRKQCRPSKGRKRGLCWCVDKYGHSLPCLGWKEGGDNQPYHSRSQ